MNALCYNLKIYQSRTLYNSCIIYFKLLLNHVCWNESWFYWLSFILIIYSKLF